MVITLSMKENGLEIADLLDNLLTKAGPMDEKRNDRRFFAVQRSQGGNRRNNMKGRDYIDENTGHEMMSFRRKILL